MGFKRKIIENRQKTPFKVNEKAKFIVEKAEESDYESENEVKQIFEPQWCRYTYKLGIFQENLLNSIENGENDSSDSEGEELVFESDDDDVLSFESADSDYGGEEHNPEEDSADDVNSDSSPEEDEEDSEEDEPEKEGEEIDEETKKLLEESEKQEEELVDIGKYLDDAPPKTKGVTVFQDHARPSNADEYDNGDTSDEEDIRNTVGNIPMHWYDEYKHIGYDWEAKKITKPPKTDKIDDFLKKMEDPNFWRTVKDPQTGQNVVLSDEDIGLIKRIMAAKNPDESYEDFTPWVDWFTSEVETMPIRNIPDHKRSFLPSVGEKKKIGRLVHALKMGWMKTREEVRRLKALEKGPKFHMIWETDYGREEMRRIHDHVVAPKRPLPGHAESYNPPPEYLFDEKEMEEWNSHEEEPWKRKLHFIPQKFNSLREVPAYEKYMRERFLRCLDLYLCPRGKRTKVTIAPEYLIPKLPSPRDLQPFPTLQNLIYKGHTDMVRTISIEPKGEYLLTGSDDMTVKSEYNL